MGAAGAAIGMQAAGRAEQGVNDLQTGQRLDDQADDTEIQASAANMAAVDKAAQNRRSLAETLSTQRAIFASRGVDPGGQRAQNIARRSTNAANRDLSTMRLTAALNNLQMTKTVDRLKAGAKLARAQSLTKLGSIAVVGYMFGQSRK